MCGGVWSDSGEVNLLGQKELVPLMKVLPKKPQHSSIQNHLCPKDRTTLEIFRSESVPPDVTLFHCKQCYGMFFPEKTLTKYKKAQTAKVEYFKLWQIPLHSVYAIALPMLLIAILGMGMFAAVVGTRQGTDIRSRADEKISTPLVISTRDTDVIINFKTTSLTTAKIKYWQNQNEVTETWISTTPKDNHTAVIKNLIPGKIYSYQLLLEEPEVLESPIHTFTAGE